MDRPQNGSKYIFEVPEFEKNSIKFLTFSFIYDFLYTNYTIPIFRVGLSFFKYSCDSSKELQFWLSLITRGVAYEVSYASE